MEAEESEGSFRSLKTFSIYAEGEESPWHPLHRNYLVKFLVSRFKEYNGVANCLGKESN